MGTKFRILPYPNPIRGDMGQATYDTFFGTLIGKPKKFTADNVAIFKTLAGTQLTESEGHPGWRSHTRVATAGDNGGPFSTTKRYVKDISSSAQTLTGQTINPQLFQRTEVGYVGPVLPLSPSEMAFPNSAALSESALMQLGSVAIARCSPSNPTADTSVFLKETLTEGIPHAFIGTLKSLAGMGNSSRRKALGDAYLNLEFGWKPFISDLEKSVEAIAHAEDIMSQYERDSGRVVRRGYYFPEFKEESESYIRGNTTPWYNPSSSVIDSSYLNRGSVTRTERTFRKIWFKGAFTYYVPPVADPLTREGVAYAIIQARKVHGLSLTPDAIWNMTPWSWMVDWFSNTSEVLSNLSDWIIDNQVLRYGYIMEHSLREWTYSFIGASAPGAAIVPPVTLVTETKRRVRATPYGFGLSFDSFSNRQKAIVAALGLSRGK
jgi:hypothetical protein